LPPRRLEPPQDERDFQSKVLEALNPPSKKRFLIVLNSAFFLWCMSALILTLGGTYYSARNQCVGDANRYLDAYSDMITETYVRLDEMTEIAETAKTRDDFISRMTALQRKEWNSQTRKSLLRFHRIYDVLAHVDEVRITQEIGNDYRLKVIFWQYLDGFDMTEALGNLYDQIQERGKGPKWITPKIINWWEVAQVVNCSPRAVVERMLGGDPAIVYAPRGP